MRTQPPGPKESPVLGNTHRYSRDPLSFIGALTHTYPDISTFTLGTERTYLVSNPADIERILVSEETKYQKPESFRSGGIDDLLGDGLLMSGGERWQRQRQRAQPAFAPNRVIDFSKTITNYAEEILDGWTDGEVIDIDPTMACATVKVIVAVMFGTRLDDATTRQIQNSLSQPSAG